MPMSTSFLRGCAILLALGAVTPALTRAQLPQLPHAGCCQTCYQPRPSCHCVTFKPVVETHFRPQSVVTWRNIQQTGYRCQPRVETVPVVTYRSRIRYEMVPYTVTRRVPQCSTRMVPQRRIRYVPNHFVGSPITPIGRWQQYNTSPLPVPTPVFQSTPVAGDYGNWTTISSRHRIVGGNRSISPTPPSWAGDLQIGSHGNHHHKQHTAKQHKHKTTAKPLSVQAPSAALVWQTPGPR